MDKQADRQTDGQKEWFLYNLLTLFAGGIIKNNNHVYLYPNYLQHEDVKNLSNSFNIINQNTKCRCQFKEREPALYHNVKNLEDLNRKKPN